MQYRVMIPLAIAAAALVAGCGRQPTATQESSAEGARVRLAVIPKGTTHEFWKAVHAGAADAAKEEGAEIIWKGPLREDDRENQIKVVEDFVVNKVNGIVLAPLDDTALRTPVADAKRNNIPVVIFDSALKSDDIVSFVATDNFAGGRTAGRHMISLLGGKGKVIMMRYQEGSASTHEREEGFLEALRNAPGIEIVSSNQFGGATTETAQKTSESLLAPYKTADGLSVDGIFCPNESTTFGMLRALQDSGLAGKVKFVGFDSSPKLVDAMRAGEINGLVLQNPYQMGYLAVRTLVRSIKGQDVETRIDTGATLATRENMDTADIQKLLAPKQM